MLRLDTIGLLVKTGLNARLKTEGYLNAGQPFSTRTAPLLFRVSAMRWAHPVSEGSIVLREPALLGRRSLLVDVGQTT